ncbi:MAG: alpha-amylase family glycosyl hydrolase [Solimonas sp.]
MTIARKRQIHLGSTSFYHCYVRCVRRAWLCGQDEASGTNYDHRKQWLVSRLRFLSYVYAIDICAYAVMSNHYHVVLHVDKERALGWSAKEVAERWQQIYNGHPLVDQWLAHPETMSDAQQVAVDELIEEWRKRLYGIDWFMRGVNETIARMANDEEQLKGRFWEGRYKSQALLDEAALLTCMAYVDLNPVRANITDDLVTSDFTSIQQRLFDHAKRLSHPNKDEKALISRVKKQRQLKAELELDDQPEAKLMKFKKSIKNEEHPLPVSLPHQGGGNGVAFAVKSEGTLRQAQGERSESMEDPLSLVPSPTRGEGGRKQKSFRNAIHDALPITQQDYFTLVDTTGRLIREDKAGYISSELKPILKRFNIDPEQFMDQVQHFHERYAHCAGSADNITSFARRFKRRWGKGVQIARQMYQEAA